MDTVKAVFKKESSGVRIAINVVWYIVLYVVCGILFLYCKYLYEVQYGRYVADPIITKTVIALIVGTLIPILVFIFESKLVNRLNLEVSKERVFGSYGKISKREISIPIEQVTNMVIAESFSDKYRSGKSVVLSSASSTIRLPYCQNSDEVLDFTLSAIKEYKTNYGQKEQATTQTIITNEVSEADELSKFKKLLDDGVITQEEFDAKKKQILGL